MSKIINKAGNSTSVPETLIRSLYVGVRFNESLATWRYGQTGLEAKNIPWCPNNPTVRTNIFLTHGSKIYRKGPKWQSNADYVEFLESTVCVQKVQS